MHFKRNLFWQVSLGIVFVFIVCHSVKWFCNIYELFHVSIEYISTFVLFKSCLSCIFCMGKQDSLAIYVSNVCCGHCTQVTQSQTFMATNYLNFQSKSFQYLRGSAKFIFCWNVKCPNSIDSKILVKDTYN